MKFFMGMVAFTVLLFSIAPYGTATEEFAEKTGLSCEDCHIDSSGGGELTKTGNDFLQKLSEEAETTKDSAFKPGSKGIAYYIRFLTGFLHIITGIFWFGTILYVHLILKPAYAAQGLPRGEVKLGLFSMLIMGITGTILTVNRIPSISFLLETRFGILLLIKISLFLIMVSTALFAVFFLGPRLKKAHHKIQTGSKKDLTADDLIQFDGKEGQPAYIAYKHQIYDVTTSNFWERGVHLGRHKAGRELTEMLSQAPHGEEKVLELPKIGKLIHPEIRLKRSRFEKVFYFFAYLNLVMVFFITLILALWKWW